MSPASAIARGGPRPAPGTLNQLLFTAAEHFDRPDALQFKRDGAYRPISHRQLLERVRNASLGLRKLGVARGDRVAILSENRPEWAIADYACLVAGMIDVPVYPSLPPDQIAAILKDSGSVVAFVSTLQQAKKVHAIRSEVPLLRTVISFDAAGGRADMTIAELESRGGLGVTGEVARSYRDEALAVQPDDVATMIYTSGTTGEPKGVMLTHDNIFSNVQAALRCIPFEGEDVTLSFLPLSHIFERMGGHFLAMATGTSIAYAESFETVPSNLVEVRPTIVFSVPRLYEKMYARVLQNAEKGGFLKKLIFSWSKAVGERWANAKLAGQEPSRLLARQYTLAHKLVFAKLHARTGGRLRSFVSGGAPLSPEINKFFYSAGLMILEGYGLTETSPVIAVNTPEDLRIGTVGKPIDGVEVMIAADGEILTRGPHVMKGYYNKPEATRDAIDANGWFHTGDIGRLEDGFLRITDRKKDLIVTAGGKNIAPQPIENALKANRFFTQAVMIGDKRSYPVMLAVPNVEQLERWARRNRLQWNDPTELIALPPVVNMLRAEMRSTLSGLAPFEMPKKLGLLAGEFSIDGGELTPSHKVKRKVISERHADLIESLYAG